jgi:carboxymethylenebutenolidase
MMRSMPTSSEAPTRRGLIVTGLGAGFALAVRPVSASTITTGTDGIDSGEVEIPTANGAIAAYRAGPHRGKTSGKGRSPVLLVVHEIFGVHEHIKDVCRRLAKEGYLAVAPDLFARQGDVSKLTDFNEIRNRIVSKVPDAQVMSDLDATLAWAKGPGGADGGKVGITGFCWGGRVVWLYAAHNAALDAGVAWYGRLVGDKGSLQPRHPVDVARELKAPVLGLYGGKDQGIPQSTVATMREALAAGSKAAKRSEIKVYPEAGHAFFADYRPSYRPDDAKDAWARMLAWLKASGAG